MDAPVTAADFRRIARYMIERGCGLDVTLAQLSESRDSELPQWMREALFGTSHQSPPLPLVWVPAGGRVEARILVRDKDGRTTIHYWTCEADQQGVVSAWKKEYSYRRQTCATALEHDCRGE
jgi:hypothetical protein